MFRQDFLYADSKTRVDAQMEYFVIFASDCFEYWTTASFSFIAKTCYLT